MATKPKEKNALQKAYDAFNTVRQGVHIYTEPGSPADFVKNKIQNALYPVISPMGTGNMPVPTATPTPLPMYGGYTLPEYEAAITQGYQNWGQDLPAAKYAKVFAAQIPNYPILQKYPFLLPAIALKETSAGQPYNPVTKTGVTYPNNYLNWGIGPQAQGTFSPQSVDEVIQKAASGIGQRMPYYEPFRQNQDLNTFSEVYAPLKSNPTTGGPHYAKSLQEVMSVFNTKLPKRRQ